MSSQKIDQILRSVEMLRPMPTSVTRLLRALEEPHATSQTISEFIGLDQALSAAVLQVANSAALGYAGTCISLPEAVMRLGFKRLKTLALGIGASGPLMRRLSGYRLGAGELWSHSVATAVASQWLARTLRTSDPEEAYVVGLLHDMGKLVLDQYVAIDYSVVAATMQKNNVLLWQVEQKVLGIDHAAVGCIMARKWNFPTALEEAIRYHHAPSLAQGREEVAAIVNIADAIMHQIEPKQMGSSSSTVIHPEALRILRLNETRLAQIQTEITRLVSTVDKSAISV